MKRFYTFLLSLVIILQLTVCTNDSDKMNLDNEAMLSQEKIYPEADNSKELSGTTCLMVRTILTKVPNTDFAKTLGNIEITEEQYNEIAAFTDELTVDCSTDHEKYKTVYQWITGNIEYAQGWVDNRPYEVFKSKEAICQGYADLLTVMMHTQDIPCFTVNGELYQPGNSNWYIGGHAWNYVYTGSWYVSDPTNSSSSLISSMASYAHLRPTIINIPIFEDEFCQYNFNESQLNVYSITQSTPQITIPYSVNGLKITSLNPLKALSEEVQEIYIGSNIKSLGTSSIGLNHFAPNVETLNVDPENEFFESFSNVIYKKDGNKYTIQLVAPKATSIELKAIESFDKESKIKNLENLETIVFVPGTKEIGSWTIEYCPKLHTAYIPQETVVADNAFDHVAADFKIVRGNYTNIPDIKY